MKFRFINDHKEQWPVRTLCHVLGVSPAGFYAWRSRPDSARAVANRELLGHVRRLYAQHRGRYGSRAFTLLCGRREEASAAGVWSASCGSTGSEPRPHSGSDP